MIELRNVTKSYDVGHGKRYVLQDASLVLPDEVNIAVLGPNGGGKSTFLRLIGGAESADSGEIICDKYMSWPLGMNTGFQGSLTGRQNVDFVCSINGLDREQRASVMEYILDFSELKEYFDMPINSYSSGMRSRLGFGLSMSFQFDVYLIDELTAVGDRIFKEKAKAEFEKLKNRAQLIYVSHNLDNLRESCQSAVFVREGMIDYYPDIDEGIEAYNQYVDIKKGKTRENKKNKKKMKRIAEEAAQEDS